MSTIDVGRKWWLNVKKQQKMTLFKQKRLNERKKRKRGKRKKKIISDLVPVLCLCLCLSVFLSFLCHFLCVIFLLVSFFFCVCVCVSLLLSLLNPVLFLCNLLCLHFPPLAPTTTKMFNIPDCKKSKVTVNPEYYIFKPIQYIYIYIITFVYICRVCNTGVDK